MKFSDVDDKLQAFVSQYDDFSYSLEGSEDKLFVCIWWTDSPVIAASFYFTEEDMLSDDADWLLDMKFDQLLRML